MSDGKNIKGETAVTINSTVPSVQEAKAAVKPNDPIFALASNPDVDVQKINALIKMRYDEEDRQAARLFNKAMSLSQGQIQAVVKNRKNNHTNSEYADMGAIVQEVMPVYTSQGLSVSFREETPEKENNIKMTAVVRHKLGHVEYYSKEMPPDGVGTKGATTKTAIHARASSGTYIRRYLLGDIFNIPEISAEDLDGSNYEVITEEQVNQIEAFIADNNLDMARFKSVLRTSWKVDSIAEIPVSKFSKVMKKLQEKVAI